MPQRESALAGIILPSEALKMVLSEAAKRMTKMNSSATYTSDLSFPYVLICSTLGTVVSLASVWLSTAAAFSPVIGA